MVSDLRYNNAMSAPNPIVARDRDHLKELVDAAMATHGDSVDLNFINVSNVTNMKALFKDSAFIGNITNELGFSKHTRHGVHLGDIPSRNISIEIVEFPKKHFERRNSRNIDMVETACVAVASNLLANQRPQMVTIGGDDGTDGGHGSIRSAIQKPAGLRVHQERTWYPTKPRCGGARPEQHSHACQGPVQVQAQWF